MVKRCPLRVSARAVCRSCLIGEDRLKHGHSPKKCGRRKRCWRNGTVGRTALALDLARTPPSFLSAYLPLGSARYWSEGWGTQPAWWRRGGESPRSAPAAPSAVRGPHRVLGPCLKRRTQTRETLFPQPSSLPPSLPPSLPFSPSVLPNVRVGSCRWTSGRRSRRRGLVLPREV